MATIPAASDRAVATPRIESLLSARKFIAPKLVDDRLYFISDMGGHFSLYVMDAGGSVPEQLLPPQIVLPQPKFVPGEAFYVFPALGKILVLIDRDGDERYQPMLIPSTGGWPAPAFGDALSGFKTAALKCDAQRKLVYLHAASQTEARNVAYRGDLTTGRLEHLAESTYGCYVDGVNAAHSQVVIADGYAVADTVLYLWTQARSTREPLFGVPLDQRRADAPTPTYAIGECHFVADDHGLLCITSHFEDTYGPAYLPLTPPHELQPVVVEGVRHSGLGELESLKHLTGDRYLLEYNIDGATWLYEAVFDHAALRLTLDRVICGQEPLANGVLGKAHYDPASDRYALSFATAATPAQLYVVERDRIVARTRERVLGVPDGWLATGEDASFDSFDGLRVSARLYLPAAELDFAEPRPVIVYIHGGPQGQERPDFAWFSMPLIQFLTLNGFAVFVPNVRGSTGYGLRYMQHVVRDWGGQDRLDHVHALKLLANDSRLDTTRCGVMGRSYGGYMTLTLAARHPELWTAAVDMFGPYDLLSFADSVPATWKPFIAAAVGDPVKDREMLIERSPVTYLDALACPLLVIQGQNDPRVVEPESRALVEKLRAAGKPVEYIVFADEGHDVLKFENRVRCYTAITDFFREHLRP
jgi:acetyl esterase/lipase